MSGERRGASKRGAGRPRAALLDGAAELLREVLAFQFPADAVVSRYFRAHARLGQRERHVLAETVYGVVRNLRLWRQLAQGAPEGSAELRLLALGWQGDVASAGFAPGLLAWREQCLAQDLSGLPPAVRYSLPDWLASQWQRQCGAEFEALAESLLRPAPLDLRANLLKGTREQAREALREQGIDSEPTPLSPWGLRVRGKPALQRSAAFEQGLVEVQDEGSQLLALLLAPRRGEMVVDFCAGAGGKTLALGAMMRGSGRLYAFDVSQARLERLRPRLARSGLSNVYPVAIRGERDERVQRLAGKIDRVLVDAPCSGVGTLRRNPDLKWRSSEAEVPRLAGQQAAILAQAARLLKPGGRLVYATCSLLEQENQHIVQAFLDAHPGWRLLDAGDWWRQQQLPGILEGPWLRLWPQRHGTDGFFAALIERNP
ncbi:MAG: RsmB/NOP family class I SAM-dependent RNA methyltransferase [Betaproteobacteria bacterium]|nr:RsmB/NOP family class I SAM-dependent RNA methyltransferase [Betaproteobacteria bacterium]MBU6511382.1 RsmB/NOP family class I SAM-dependent RNA methyltransferase [Betaproteobacteria bacterium]MDE1955655.1 RsmB/NOP family class I SAM-dependent RNA methyltransferase [Betaproteobacteria bacterium]MDE2153695.1 RsmB/NOP family class I SAM-dependent RNA methyltransferase [Betaproteobacteria bacterium]MDE2478921.1 RsmB/NOP family class I SAM-dependent RNA methyltransferase [Betaproteobacteria bact